MTGGAGGGVAALLAARVAAPLAWGIKINDAIRSHFQRSEVASLLGLSYGQIRGLVENGKLDTSRGQRVSLHSIATFLGVSAEDLLLADLDGTPRLAFTADELADLANAHPTLLRRALAKGDLPAGWTGHQHVIPVGTALALLDTETAERKTA